MNNSVYLDYAATTPTDPQVVEEMNRYLGPSGIFGNPSSTGIVLGRKQRPQLSKRGSRSRNSFMPTLTKSFGHQAQLNLTTSLSRV